MKNNFFETAILNQTGLWNGYGMIKGINNLGSDFYSIARLLGFKITTSYVSRIEKLFRHSYKNAYTMDLYEAPKIITDIIVVDKNLESNFGIISSKSLKNVKQWSITYIKKSKSGNEISDLTFWMLFKVKPSVKLEGRASHYVEVYLEYIHDYVNRNIPQFEFRVKVPQCFVEESNKNPEFIKEILTKLSL